MSSWVDGVQAARQARKAIASGSACSHGVSYAYHGTWCGSSTSALFEAKLREGEKERERERETETETETEIETQRHRDGDRERETQRERQKETKRERERDRERDGFHKGVLL